MATKIGERVTAILSVDGVGRKVYMLGEGIYSGNEIPHDAAGPMASMLVQYGMPSPKIDLDSGEVVYGCECWWGPVAQVQAQYAGFTIIPVSITEERKKVGGPCADC